MLPFRRRKKKMADAPEESGGIQMEEPKKTGRMKMRKVNIDDIVFASWFEGWAYTQFRDSDNVAILAIQPRFELQPKFRTKDGENIRKIEYVADFRIVVADKGEFIIDTKGFEDEKFKIKHKLFRYTHQDEVPLLILHNRKEVIALIS